MARLAFGGFELDPSSGELWKGGDCIHIQEQPLRLLLCLLERPGQLVSRDELRRRMWDGGVHVSFEDGLNAAAWRLRQALGDSSERPTFIETVPRKGYRFIGTVLPLPGHGPPPSGSFPLPVYRPDSEMGIAAVRGVLRRHAWFGGQFFVLMAGLALAGGAGLWFLGRPSLVAVAIAPLVNGTGDPKMDYFASALGRQVIRDLQAIPGVRVVQLAGATPVAKPDENPDLKVNWSLEREPGGYRILVRLTDREGRAQGQTLLHVMLEDLHEAHGRIAAFVAHRAGRENPGH